jgi:nitrogen fixation protein FixH
MKRRERIFTGRQALICVLLFFGVIVLVNGIMIWFDLQTGSGS